MPGFEIVAHRGVPTVAPQNTIPAFQRALDLGADAIELDVRLTGDRVPVIAHLVYLDTEPPRPGPIFGYTFDQLQEVALRGAGSQARIATLATVLEMFGGRVGLEIEVKGPEPESVVIVAEMLRQFPQLWASIEVTSSEPILLREMQARCPGIATDLLFPRSEPWMKLEAVAHFALHRARQARARAVHLHPTQLAREVVSTIRSAGIEVHAWDVNDEAALQDVVRLGIPRICTDQLEAATAFRRRLSPPGARPWTI